MKVNAEKSKVTRPTQTKYLGFSFWATKGGKWKPKPHIKSYQKLKRKLKQLTKRSWSISLDERIKKIKKRYKALRQLGMEHELAFACANTRKSYYQICKTTYIQFAINNERLRKRGLVFLLDQYEKVHI